MSTEQPTSTEIVAAILRELHTEHFKYGLDFAFGEHEYTFVMDKTSDRTAKGTVWQAVGDDDVQVLTVGIRVHVTPVTDRTLTRHSTTDLRSLTSGPTRHEQTGNSDMAYLIEDEDGAPYPEGVQAIARERARQIIELGYDEAHDGYHAVTDLVIPAVQLLGGQHHANGTFTLRPANPDAGVWQRDDLVRAGALIAAAIDRLDNAGAS